MENRGLEEKKALLRMIAKQIGLTDYNIIIESKKMKPNYSRDTINGINIATYWIDKININLGFDIREKSKKTKIVMYRNAAINILYNNLNISKYAISESFEKNHTTILHSIKESNKWLDVSDQAFLMYYNYIKKIII